MNERRVPAVAEISKSGLLYVLDGMTGEPVWGVEERPVPQSKVPGEGQTGQLVPAGAGAPMTYRNNGAYGRFVDLDGHPCTVPPWGELSAVDTHTGNVAWRVPLGTYDDLEAKGIKNTRATNLGGSIATGRQTHRAPTAPARP